MSNEAIDWAVKQEVCGDDGRGNAARKLILLLLANRADDSWVCWPSRKLLAEEAGITPRQVSKHLEALEEAGLIRRAEWERADGGQGANVYVLGATAETPLSCTTRGGGRIRPGGWSNPTRAPGRQRQALNPQEKPTGKPSVPAAREESRRRSSAKADEARDDGIEQRGTQGPPAVRPLDVGLILHLVTEASREPDAYARQIETIKSRAPRLWRDAAEDAAKRFKELEKPEAVNNRASMDHMTYQYVLSARRKNLPAWLIGPLLPYMPTEANAS